MRRQDPEELRRRLVAALEKALSQESKIPYTEEGITVLEAIVRWEIRRFHGGAN